MNELENRQGGVGSSAALEDRLDSWKAIAAYLGRGVRTVQRWEREEGLPVHRLAHEKRGTVYAHKHEVAAWWESRRVDLSAQSSEAAEAARPVAGPSLDRLTWMSAATFWPAMSSDGRLLAYISDGGRDGTLPQIWLQQVGGSPACLTSGDCERSHLSFFADDTRLAFTAADHTGSHVFAMPTLGGEPRVLKRDATGGRVSPDGKWLAYLSVERAVGVRIASLDGAVERTVAPDLVDVSFVIWSPDGRYVLVQGHRDPAAEPEYWVLAVDGSTVVNTEILQRLRETGCFPLLLPAAWVGDSLVFSLITPTGVALWRQRLTPSVRPKGDAERLTRGTEFDCFATAGAGRVAFVSAHPDHNLWSVAIDPVTGTANGAVRRLTRGPGYVAHLTVSRDGRTLAYFNARRSGIGAMLRNLDTDAESAFASLEEFGYPAISPSGRQLALSSRPPGPKTMRPIFVAQVGDSTVRRLGEDYGGRPREWLDERFLLVERFGSRLHSVALLDTASGEQRPLLAAMDCSISNARLSPDGQWIAFDATRIGRQPSVVLAPLRTGEAVALEDWIIVDASASHPFWSADGTLLYYLPTIPSTDFRTVVRARRFDATAALSLGEPFTAFTSSEMVVPASMSGMTPVATRDRLILVLGDFRGDVWMLDLDSAAPR